MNPTLYDLILLHVAEEHPGLAVQYWGHDGQIRISLDYITPMDSSALKYSLVSIVDGNVYYFHSKEVLWLSYKYMLESPDFFIKLDEAIEHAIKGRKKHELQKSRAD